MMATGGGEEERNTLTIFWRIENLSCFHKELHGNGIWSAFFYPHTLKDKLTQLYLFPRGETGNDANICLFLRTHSPFPVDCEFSFLTCDGSPIVTRKGIRGAGLIWAFDYKMTDCLTQEELFVTKKSTFLHQDTLTVRCRLWKSEGNFPHNEFFSARSRIEFAEDCILWPIGGFNGLNFRQNETFLLKLPFVLQDVCLDLKCALTVNSAQNPELSIEVTADEIIKEFLAKLEVSVMDKRQEAMKLGSEENLFNFSEAEQSWVLPKFVLTENLREKLRLLKFGKSLDLNFHLTAVCRDISKCIENKIIGMSNLEHEILDAARTASTFSEANCQTSEQNGDTPVHLRKASTFSEVNCQTLGQNGDTPPDLQRRNDYLAILGEDLFSQYQKQTFSDFELRAGDIAFPVHKVVLSARSPVFTSMFSNGMEESNSKSLDVPDLDAHALNRMLTFMYGGTLEPDLTLESAAKLYYAADKYQVDSLKNLCSSLLQSQICVSNVSDILTLADRHQDSDLTSVVYNFILSHLDDVMDSKEWEKFLDVNPALAGKSAHLLYKKNRERKKEDPKN